VNKESDSKLVSYNESPNLEKLAVFLVCKIEDPTWLQLFECCIPLLKENVEVLELLLPYLVYWCLRSQKSDENTLPDELSAYLNCVLTSKNPGHIELTLKLLDFLTITTTQDKNKFRNHLEANSKLAFNENLFSLNLHQDSKDFYDPQFLTVLSANLSIKSSFMVVRKLERLTSKIEIVTRSQAAKLVRNLKRCVFNMEDNYRQTI
jgi:hypothetical protein